MSYLDLLDRATLFRKSHEIDKEIALRWKSKRCDKKGCGGPLHKAHYQRKPRGEACEIPEEYAIRMGWCCGWCRRRCLPPSCLFWGRRVYWGIVIILVTAAKEGLNHGTSLSLSQKLNVPPRTIGRWVRYFKDVFPKTNQWQRLRSPVTSHVRNDDLPRALLKLFLSSTTCALTAVIHCMKFLAGEMAHPAFLNPFIEGP